LRSEPGHQRRIGDSVEQPERLGRQTQAWVGESIAKQRHQPIGDAATRFDGAMRQFQGGGTGRAGGMRGQTLDTVPDGRSGWPRKSQQATMQPWLILLAKSAV